MKIISEYELIINIIFKLQKKTLSSPPILHFTNLKTTFTDLYKLRDSSIPIYKKRFFKLI